VLAKEEVLQFEAPLQGVQVTYAGPAYKSLEEVREIEKEAYDRGYQAAEQYYKQQLVEYRKELHSLEESLVKNIDQAFNEMVDAVHGRMPGLALKLVKKVWSGILWDGDAVRGMIEELLSEYCSGNDTVEVLLSASDLQTLEGFDPNTPFGKVILKEDMTLRPGDCMMRTSLGLIDARLETKFKKIEKELGGVDKA